MLTGSYVLDALSGPELGSFERHLRHCRSCDAEVRGLRETAARLATARALQPPSRLRQRVLAATSRTRQLPPPPAAPGLPAVGDRPETVPVAFMPVWATLAR